MSLKRQFKYILQIGPVVQLQHAPIYGKRTLYNLWHSLSMIKKLFVEQYLVFYLCPLNYIVLFSFTVAMNQANTTHI